LATAATKTMLAESKVLIMDSKVMSVSFRTQRQGDVESPSGTECATASPRAWQAAFDADQGTAK
jgi:hypothetical protein